MKTENEEIDKCVKMKTLTVECAVAQGVYVVIDLENKDDCVTIILHEHYHPFSKNDCENGSPDARCFNLAHEFQDYACNAPWTGKRLGRLLNNVTRVNGALQEAKKGKEKKRQSFQNDQNLCPSPCHNPQDHHRVVHQGRAGRRVNVLTPRWSRLD